jgi:hypothetical protein
MSDHARSRFAGAFVSGIADLFASLIRRVIAISKTNPD